MKGVVIDPAVGMKWVVTEAGSREAAELRLFELYAPESILSEWGEILRRKVQRGELGPSEAAERLALLTSSPVHLVPVSGLVTDAARLAAELDLPVATSLYASLAARLSLVFVTCDRHLVHALEGRRTELSVRLLGTAVTDPS